MSPSLPGHSTNQRSPQLFTYVVPPVRSTVVTPRIRATGPAKPAKALPVKTSTKVVKAIKGLFSSLGLRRVLKASTSGSLVSPSLVVHDDVPQDLRLSRQSARGSSVANMGGRQTFRLSALF